MQAAVAEGGALSTAIEALQREDRTLKPLVPPSQPSEAVLSMISVADPEKPVALADLVQLFNADVEGGSRSSAIGPAWGKIASIVLVLIGLTALWKWTPLAEFLDGNQITRWARRVGEQWWAPPAAILALYAGGAHDVSASPDHAVRGGGVRSAARLRVRDARDRAVRVDDVRDRAQAQPHSRAACRRGEAQRDT